MSFDPTIWGTVSDWVVALTAVGAVWFGRRQLEAIARESGRQADVARAELMLQIDQIFEGAEVGASRMAIQTLRNVCEAEAMAGLATLEGGDLLAASATLFSKHVNALYEAYKKRDANVAVGTAIGADFDPAESPHLVAGKHYTVLMALPYWMETVGLLTRKQLMVHDDVLDLYDAVFINVLACFDDHIRHRRLEMVEPNDRFLEHATWLRDQARRRNLRSAQRAAGLSS